MSTASAALRCIVVVALPALLLPSSGCQQSDLAAELPAEPSAHATLAFELEGRWLITSLEEEGEALVGEDGIFDYATLDFDYEGGAGGELEITLASPTARIHLDGAYTTDATAGAVSFVGETRYSYGEASAIVEPATAEFALAREGGSTLSLIGQVSENRWVIEARRD